MAFPNITGIDMTGACHPCCDGGDECSFTVLDFMELGTTVEVVVPGDCFGGTYTLTQWAGSPNQYSLLPYPAEWEDVGDVWATITTNDNGVRYCSRVILYGVLGPGVRAIYANSIEFPAVLLNAPLALHTLAFSSSNGPCDYDININPIDWPSSVTLGPG